MDRPRTGDVRYGTRISRWARLAATVALIAGTLGALVNLTMPGGDYEVIVPIGFGTLTRLPCLAGTAAVISLWRHGHGKRPTVAATD